jgi:hypothetical protein
MASRNGKRRKIDVVEATRRMDKSLKRENATRPKPYTPDLVPRKDKPADKPVVAEVEEIVRASERASRNSRKSTP